ncbi:hypothetical protein EJ02DRAFT_339189 [Clathrospora elynae]|uniref:Acyltransferase 3 domain-containing protein n=1 Tax=Clathrospora elynae TaxID=706981 RepID=A0A6A5SXM9_9PLEO|nr:hypothetical protein EJ02DRAFT_339189 [Clathrospora elynae]
MPKPPTRTHALDNLRTSLTALVVLHHASIPYGGAGSWLYASRLYVPNSSPTIVAVFLWEKWRRLGVPTLVYSLVGKGLVRGIIAARLRDETWRGVGREVLEGVGSEKGVSGPMWYCAVLFIFDVAYAVLLPLHFARASTQKLLSSMPPNTAEPSSTVLKTTSEPRPFDTVLVLIALCLTSTSSFIIRLSYPVGTHLWPLSLQLAYTPQYTMYYIVGVYIHRTGYSLHTAISPRTLRIVGTITGVITVVGFVWIRALLDQGVVVAHVFPLASGGANFLALLYAFWNEFAGFVIASFLLRAFHDPNLGFLAKEWRVGGVEVEVAKYSYAAFLVHTPLLVDLQCLFSKWGLEDIGTVPSVLIVGILAVVESWLVGAMLKVSVEELGFKGYL